MIILPTHWIFLTFFIIKSIYSCEYIDKRIESPPDQCGEECGLFDSGITCTNAGCRKHQKWQCRWQCQKLPPVETQVRKCCKGYKRNKHNVCIDIDECADGGIARSCYGCKNTPGSYKCICPRGFRPLVGSYDNCTDIDECLIGTAGCDGSCTNTNGSFICHCPGGFQLGADNRSCQDIDECDSDEPPCSSICLNTYGSYSCGCNLGYEISRINHLQCVDIDECSSMNIQKCSHYCHNTNGSFYCSCPSSMTLATDQLTCLEYLSANICTWTIVLVCLLLLAVVALILLIWRQYCCFRKRSTVIVRTQYDHQSATQSKQNGSPANNDKQKFLTTKIDTRVLRQSQTF